MHLPDTSSLHAFRPTDAAFHQALLQCIEAFVRDNDLSHQTISAQCPQSASVRYGLGGKGLSPFGYYHPSILLPATTKYYSRGRIVKKAGLRTPDYTYHHAANGTLCRIEEHFPGRESWPDPCYITYLLPVAGRTFALTYLTRDLRTLPLVLTGLAWSEQRGAATWHYRVSSSADHLNFAIAFTEVEITEPWQDRLLCSRLCGHRIKDGPFIESMSAEFPLPAP